MSHKHYAIGGVPRSRAMQPQLIIRKETTIEDFKVGVEKSEEYLSELKNKTAILELQESFNAEMKSLFNDHQTKPKVIALGRSYLSKTYVVPSNQVKNKD